MSNWPLAQLPPLVTIIPWSMECLAQFPLLTGNYTIFSAVSAVWPTANKALFLPFQVFTPITVKKMFWHNGAAVSGNVDVGIYDLNGVKIVSSGSIAQATINVIQEADITDTQLGPGTYYMAMAVDNTTAAFMRAVSGAAAYCKMAGMAEQTTAFALPANATLATITSDYIPLFGLSTRSVI